MGLYDEVSIKCPECGTFFLEQSKDGDCYLRTYSLDSAPPEILVGLTKSDIYCPNGHKVKILLDTKIIGYAVAAK